MKKLFKLLPIVALFIGTSVALATTTKQTDPTLYHDEVLGWQEIPEGFRVECDFNPEPDCKATGTIGSEMPIPGEKGYGTLVEN